jgi:NitT/TauT family transport system substrate-binding protein
MPGVNSEEKWTETINIMTQYAGLQKAGPANTYWDASYASKG